MANEDYVKYEMELFENLEQIRKLRSKIISAGKLEKAQRTGERYQMITESEAEQIRECLDKMYTVYGNISRCAINIQQEMVYIKKAFENSLREAK